MNFFKLPFFNRTHTIATTINKKFFKNVSVLILALLSVCFSLIYISFIFFSGPNLSLNKFIADVFLENPDIRNLFISIMHTFASLFAILYASFYIDRKKYDGKIVAPAITTVIIFVCTMFLAWRCYFSNDLDILVFISTTDGIMFSVFLLFLSILQYDILSKKTSRRFFASSVVRILTIVCMSLFAFSIFTYYGYFTQILAMISSYTLSGFTADALVLFLFMFADLCLIITILMMFVIEHKLNIMLKEFTEKVRSKNQGDKN